MSLDHSAVLALRAARPAGSFFEVEFGAAGRDWVPLAAFGTDRTALRSRVAVGRQAIAAQAGCAPDAVPLRVAASIDLLGLTARLVSPALGAVVVAGVAPVLDGTQTWSRGPGPVALTGAAAGRVATVLDAARALYEGVVAPVVAALVAAYRAEYGVSPHVLWGDVASALNGAAAVLGSSPLAQRLPADQVVAAMLGMAELRATARSLPPRFVRNSCCLYYRVPAGGLCGDCVLAS